MARICLVSHNAAGAFRAEGGGHIGGVERQTRLLAHYLVDRGHEVAVVTWQDGDEPDWTDDKGVRILGTCRADAGRRWLRFVSPRWTSLVRALRRARADVYYHNAAEVETGQIALWCRLNRKPFIYSVASEPACERSLRSLNGSVEKTFYRFALRAATTIVVQTRAQQSKLLDNFGRRSVLLPMPCDVTAVGERMTEPPDDTFNVLWIGRLVPLKRLEMLLAAARERPDTTFTVVAPENSQSTYSAGLVKAAGELENVRFLTRLPFHRIWEQYRAASVLACTSEYEGFPNTFLEAMACGLPIVTTFDPDGVVSRRSAGLVVTDAAGLVSALDALRDNPARRQELGTNAYRYYRSHHAPDVALPGFHDTIVSHTSVSHTGARAETGRH